MPNTTKPAFTWEEFKTQKIAVKCETPKEFMRILENCKMLSMTWEDGTEIDMGDTIDDNVWNAQKGDMCIYYNETGIDMASALMLRNKNFTIIPSTSVPDLKYRPFRELKADLILRTVRSKTIPHTIHFISTVYEGENIVVIADDPCNEFDQHGLFELYEFFDPKTGETSPCGECIEEYGFWEGK